MKICTLALAVIAVLPTVASARPATYADWEFVRNYMFERIQDSTCPNAGDQAALSAHWDYDLEGYLAKGMSMEEALQQDCTLFHRFRNPAPLGTRLIRHVFHDAAGGFDGFVNVHDLVENPALESTMIVLNEDYARLQLEDGVPLRDVISLADFTAWAGHAALLRAIRLQNGTDRTGQRQVEVLPEIPVRVGRPSYEPTSPSDTGPIERFPTGLGPQGTGQLITDYFATEFGFSAQETVTIMGAHTLGGARREDSGFAGMWTQSKGKLNNDWQKQLVFPLPLLCVGGPGKCDYFSEAGNDILADAHQKQTCVTDDGRCHGWEQTVRRGNGGKFQWQHSCRADGTGCTHLMLNVDIGLFYDLNGYLCTADDETNKVPATAGRTCKEGMVKAYPPTSSCSVEDPRVLATCFEPNDVTQSLVSYDADNMEEWVANFGPLFDRLTTHKLLNGVQVDDLTVLFPPASNCKNDRSWVYTVPVRPNGSGGDKRKCQFILRKPAERCELMGDNGVPAYQACCVACEGFAPGQSFRGPPMDFDFEDELVEQTDASMTTSDVDIQPESAAYERGVVTTQFVITIACRAIYYLLF